METASSHTIPLNARQIARELLPTGPDKELIFEEFLLWPPDLFTFTSQILRITGAYHLVVSPPRNEQLKIVWPPQDEWPEMPDASFGTSRWGMYVREVGMQWRQLLEQHFSETELWSYKERRNTSERTNHLWALVGEPRSDNKEWIPGRWVPPQVGLHWNTLRRGMQEDGKGNIQDLLCEEEDDVKKLDANWEVFKALMTLHAVVDETCVGWGIRGIHYRKADTGKWELDEQDTSADNKRPVKFAASLLVDNGTLATINSRRGRVLPKRHTPNLGITLRSLSNNLAFHTSSVEVKWKVGNKNNAFTKAVAHDSKNKVFSILLLPWPMEISALDFEAVPHQTAGTRLNMQDKYGLFYYSPTKPWFKKADLVNVLESAQRETKQIDMVIMPESALTTTEVEHFEEVIGRREYGVSAYVAGVRNTQQEIAGRVFTDNMVYCKMGDEKKGEYKRVVYDPAGALENSSDIQYKHHRWKVDRFQIENYSLGHALSPFKNWWEAIKIRRRKVTFINVGNELTICPLICEDLARQDPIADLIRTVGPSLVITILMDGPQTTDRWPARYASVLSEDPGSAVITLTSVGMVDRWKHPYRETRRVVALWNDGQGSEREIPLESGSKGILLSLSVSGSEETSADGRGEIYPTNKVILGGIRQIYC